MSPSLYRVFLRILLRLAVALVLAYVAYRSLEAILLFIPVPEGLLGSSTGVGLLVAGLVFLLAYFRPWGHVFLVPITLLAASYLYTAPQPSRIIVDGAWIVLALGLSAGSEALEAERYGAAETIYLCRAKCVAASFLAEFALYGSILAVSYYAVILFKAVYDALLVPRGTGLFYELWSLSSQSLLVQGLLFFTAIGVMYVVSSKIIAPLLYAMTAPRRELHRLLRDYIAREKQAVLGARKWYHVIIAQSVGYAVALPAALIGYAASFLLPSLVAGLPMPGGLDRNLLVLASVIVTSIVSYYLAKRLFLYLIAGKPNWKIILYTGIALIMIMLVVLYLSLGWSGVEKALAGLLGGNTSTSKVDYMAAEAEKRIADTMASSENLLEIVAKILWG